MATTRNATLTPQDVEAELSYAYLHAVASQAGIACQSANRTHDGLGIDATLSARQDFGPGAVLTELSVHIQLKATVRPPARRDGRLSYFLHDKRQYDRLRASTVLPPKLLAVLFLPRDREGWLRHTVEQLALFHCAYWLSLVGAPATDNSSGQTVYFPQDQVLSPDGLLNLCNRLARLEKLTYAP